MNLNNPTEKQKRDLRRIRITIWILFTICAALAVYVYVQGMPPPAHLYDDLAHCIASSGAEFYGAYWCPHCAAQKTKFGTGAQYLPYIECSLPNASGRTQVCIDNNITAYPTWVFPDGSRLEGAQTPQTLAAKTACPLPQ
jgi:hypothetical protein